MWLPPSVLSTAGEGGTEGAGIADAWSQGPDEFIKSYGREAFQRLLDQSENQVDYRLDQIKKKYNLEDDAQKVAFLQEAAQMLSTCPVQWSGKSTAATPPRQRVSPRRPWRWR